MEIPPFLNALEQSSVSVWLRETSSIFGFYFVLTGHTIGLSLVVGPNAVVDLRLLGVARQIPLRPLKQCFRLMWLGLAVNVVTGIFLVVAYPIKAFTNPVFYLKLTLIFFAVWTMNSLESRVFDDSSLSDAGMVARGKMLAIVSLALWVAVITAGRLLAYTCTYLLSGVPC